MSRLAKEDLENGSSSTSSRKLRVTLLSSEWKSIKGGLSTINRELAIQLAKHPNVEVSVYLPQCSEEDKRVAARHNVHLIEADEIPGYYDPVDWLAFVPKHHVMDCVIGHGLPLGRQVPHIKRHHNCKWIQVVHTAPEELGMYKSYADTISKGEKKHQAEVKLCKLADQVVAVGPKLAEAFSGYLRSCGKDQDVLNLTPGIFSEFADVKQTTKEIGTFSVLVFGRGDSEDFQLKGYDIAAQAIAELKDMTYKLVFVGAPSGEEEKVKEVLLQQGIDRSQLRVRCFKESREQLAKLFCEVDLAVMPSRTEGFGLDALEALSARLPVLVSGNSGLGEALKRVPYGSHCVVESEDPKEWAKAIRDVRKKVRELRLEESQELLGAYAKKYNWLEQCESLVERMLNITQVGSLERHASEEGKRAASPSITPAPKQPTLSTDGHEAHLSLRIDCESFAGPGPVGRATGKVVSSQESQEVVQGAEVVSVTSHQSPVVASKGSGEENAQNGSLPSSQQVLSLIALNYIKNVNPLNREKLNGFVQYMERVRNVLIVGCEQGSLIITVECGSLQILDELWDDYRSGHLNEMAQKFLVTGDILTAFNLSELKLTTTIVEEEYIACRGYFLGSGSGKQQRHASELSTQSQQSTSSKDSQSSRKRKEAIRRSPRKHKDVVAGAVDVDHDVLPSAHKRQKKDTTGDQSKSDGKQQRHSSELSTQSQQSTRSEDSQSSKKRKEAIRQSPRKHKEPSSSVHRDSSSGSARSRTTNKEPQTSKRTSYTKSKDRGKTPKRSSEVSTKSQPSTSRECAEEKSRSRSPRPSTSTFRIGKDSSPPRKRKEPIRQSPREHRDVAAGSVDVDHKVLQPAHKPRKPDTAGESSSNVAAAGAVDVDHDVLQSAHKRKKTDITGDQSNSDASDKEFDAGIVFALDYSSSVSNEDFQKEVEFVKQMRKSWNVPPENSVGDIVVYGDSAETVSLYPDDESFNVQLLKLATKTWRESRCRRMDLAMSKAADFFSKNSNELHLVILITAGRQISDPESKEDDHDLLVSTYEALSSKNVKVIVVPVGLQIDFRELGLIVRRPQFLFPLYGFDDMTSVTAKDIVSNIRKTADTESYAKSTFDEFSAISYESSLWENISHCSDVLEGAWYKLHDDQRKPNKSEQIKKLIRESIDNFHTTLVTENKVCISVAVFGPLGVGKSFFLNVLLNLGLPDKHKVKSGPLPSVFGSSQTPLPIYVKYGRDVQVLLHKQEADRSPDIWFHEEELGNDTLARVNDKLKSKFQEKESLSDARCLELQGPFPVFADLKKSSRTMTSSGLHLELEVDVEFVDVPGRGDETGDESVSVALRKADIVLFFDSGKSGRPVSAEDIAQIFRRREEFEFTTRPKLVHIVNDRSPSFSLSGKFDLLKKEKKENLNKAWSHFLSSSKKDDSIYKEVRAKLPQLNGEALLEKLKSESEMIYFHPENPDFFESFKKVISEHVQSVKIKQTIQPFLQKVHWAAKKLQKRIRYSLSTEKKKRKPVNVNPGEAPFEILSDMYQAEASDLITSFTEKASLPLDSDIKTLHEFLYNTFLLSSETRAFLVEILKDSLNNYTIRLMNSFLAANWSTLQDVPSDVIGLIEMVCTSRVQQFCASTAPAYLLHVLHKRKNRITFNKDEKKSWKLADYEEKEELCHNFLHILLFRAEDVLMDDKRDDQYKKSHFQLIEKLKESVEELLSVRSYEDACRDDCLKFLKEKLHVVIEFCNNSIRDFNPHPSLNVQASFTLPEKMKNAYDDDRVPLHSSHEKIVKEITGLLLNPRAKAAKGADPIKRLETMLNFKKHGDLELRQQRVDRRSWALALVNVLCDEDHFDMPLDPSLVQDRNNPETEKLLNLARKRLFAHQKSYVTCKIFDEPSLPENEIHLRKNDPKKCLEVLVSSSAHQKLVDIHMEFKDPSNHLAPIFIPTIRPGPTPDIQGNYFLEEDPWSKVSPIHDSREEEECDSVDDLNIFLVVEKRHFISLRETIDVLRHPAASKIKLMYIILPQNGRGIGVTRAIIKSLAECFKFSLYWTIDDDIQFMYQFDENDRRWHKCSITRSLLFGQRVFQTCLEKTMKELSEEERNDLLDEATEDWPKFAKKTKRSARSLLIDRTSFAEVQKNPALLHSPFANISEDCGGDSEKEDVLKKHEQEFVDKCRKRLFEDAVNHIAGVSLAHVSTRRADYMSKYPTADYMPSEQRYQVVLNNACALKGKNFVTDEVIFHKDEFQVQDKDKRNTPYWGIRGEDKSFCCALKVSGVIGYQVIRVVHDHKKLRNVFDRVGPSYIPSQSPHRSEDEDEDDDVVNIP